MSNWLKRGYVGLGFGVGLALGGGWPNVGISIVLVVAGLLMIGYGAYNA